MCRGAVCCHAFVALLLQVRVEVVVLLYDITGSGEYHLHSSEAPRDHLGVKHHVHVNDPHL